MSQIPYENTAVIVPAYNEAETISPLLKELLIYVKTVIVVDDCSTDGTAKLAHDVGVEVVSNKTNLGYDGALNAGFMRADQLGVRYAITCDSDGQHSPVELAELVGVLESGKANMVIGIRPEPARFSERVFSVYTNMRFGLKDPLCGMKGFDMDIYRQMGGFDTYGSINTQLFLYGLLSGYTYHQAPISIAERKGVSRFGRALRGNYLILRAMLFSFFLRPNNKA